MTTIDRDHLTRLMQRERDAFAAARPRSQALHEAAGGAGGSLLYGVPMSWMTRWPGPFPIFVEKAGGSHFVDVDGHEYVDLCLGDTGAMSGHSPEPTVRALERQAARGITTMLPTEDAAWVGGELRRRFGMARWEFTLTATDANRFAVRFARHVTGRPKILVHNHCYHGTVDETVVTLVDGDVRSREGSVGPPVDPAVTTRVVEINDIAALERELAHGDVAVVLIEPALTNIGIVAADPGYHDAVRQITRDSRTLLAIDETHTFCCGPGGYTAAHGLEPDVLTIGKPIAGGIPAGAFGVTEELGERIVEATNWGAADVGGVGGTLAGNALSLATMRATLGDVLTDEAFVRMIGLAERWEDGVAAAIAAHDLPWHVTRLGCRAEYMFAAQPHRTGAEAAAAFDTELDAYMHLATLNRGVLLTPFHMMALMSPATSADDVDRHTEAFEAIVAELVAT